MNFTLEWLSCGGLSDCEELTKIGFDGYAIGGLAVGETQKEMFAILESLKKDIPEDKPRYLMGVGTPSDILGAVKRGIDMFDCVLPTRSGRTGLAFTWNGRVNIKNSKYQRDNEPLDKKSTNLNIGASLHIPLMVFKTPVSSLHLIYFC